LASATVLIMVIALSLVPTLAGSRPAGSSLRLLEEFKRVTVFWQQREIADQLVAVHDSAILPELLPWLTNEDRHLRANAAYVLATLKDPRAVPILIPLLSDKEVAFGVPWALAQIGDKRAIGPLVSGLSDDDPSFRVQVIRALQELRARDAIPALTLLLNDHDH